MAQETRKFTKSGIALLQALAQQHNKAMNDALITIAEDLGLNMAEQWQVDAEHNQFVRVITPAPPAVTVAPKMPAQDIPVEV